MSKIVRVHEDGLLMSILARSFNHPFRDFELWLRITARIGNLGRGDCMVAPMRIVWIDLHYRFANCDSSKESGENFRVESC
jgi:hypothetical protein